MELTINPKGVLQIDDARIIFRNFEGRGDVYNREGDRNFAVIIPDEATANRLLDDGWNVRIKEPREEGGDPFMFLKVKVNFSGRGPSVYIQTGRKLVTLDESTVHRLDKIDIERVDLDVRPYDWEINGKTGRTSYLQAIRVTQRIDRFMEEFAEEESPEEVPF